MNFFSFYYCHKVLFKKCKTNIDIFRYHRQIEIYENYVQDLYSIIFGLIHQVNTVNRKLITPEHIQAVALHELKVTDLKREEHNNPVINAMDFPQPPPHHTA